MKIKIEDLQEQLKANVGRNIKSHQAQIESLKRRLEIIPCLEGIDLPETATIRLDHSSDVEISVPWQEVEDYENLVSQLLDNPHFNETSYLNIEGNGRVYSHFSSDEHYSFWIDISRTVKHEASVCELKQIGEEEVTKMKPVYEVVCKEGAEETW